MNLCRPIDRDQEPFRDLEGALSGSVAWHSSRSFQDRRDVQGPRKRREVSHLEAAFGPAAAALGLVTAVLLIPSVHGREIALISEKQEAAIGKEADRRIREEFGSYDEKTELRSYVSSIGAKVAAKSKRKGIDFTFEVLDTPEVNAFSLPGGFIYVTRGILARLNSEDELAAVLGHEVAHVAGRHGAREISEAVAARIGKIGPTLFTEARHSLELERIGRAALRIVLEGRRPDQEREADDLAIGYVQDAGYNPTAVADFLSHSGTSERATRVKDKLTLQMQKEPGAHARPLRREAYVQAIEGISVGWHGRTAYVQDNRYVNTQHDYSLEIPKGWTVRLLENEVVLSSPSEGYKASLRVEPKVRPGVSGDLAGEYVRSAAREGLEPAGPVTKAGLPAGEAAIARLHLRDQNGAVSSIRKLFLVRFDRTYVLTFAVPADRVDATDRTFMHLAGSIKFLRPDDVSRPPEPRLTLHKVESGETWSSIAAKETGSESRGPRLAEYNGVDSQQEPEPGALVKIPPAAVLE